MGVSDELRTRYADAVLRKDHGAFLALYDPEVAVFDTWERWSYDREAWSASVREWFGSLGKDRVRVTFTEVSSGEENAHAWWCGFVRYAGVDEAGTELRAMENRLSWMLRKTDGNWTIVHEHTSVPVNSADLKGTLRRE